MRSRCAAMLPDFSLAMPCCRSVFQRPSAGLSNPDTADRLAASLGLALRCCKSGADESRYHSAFKTDGEHHCFADTERTTGKQSECPSLFRAEMTLSRGLPHPR